MVDMRSDSMPIPSEVTMNTRKLISGTPNYEFRHCNRGRTGVVTLRLVLGDLRAPSCWSNNRVCHLGSIQ